jgi:hypothetical protein
MDHPGSWLTFKRASVVEIDDIHVFDDEGKGGI